jgi:hypothetical protein
MAGDLREESFFRGNRVWASFLMHFAKHPTEITTVRLTFT